MSLHNTLTFGRGMKDGLPIAFGYLSVSFAFGMLALEKGLPLWSPVLISVTNFTGTGQFVGVNLMAQGAALAEIGFTILIINLRYLLMSLSLSQRVCGNVSLPQRLLIAFGNTDEIFAVSMQQREPLNFKYMMGLILCAYAGWIAGTTLGAFASSALPDAVRSALGIAIYAMFIAIIVPPARQTHPILMVVLIAVFMSCVFRWTPGLNRVSSGWVIIICGVAASAFGALRYPTCSVKDGEGHA